MVAVLPSVDTDRIRVGVIKRWAGSISTLDRGDVLQRIGTIQGALSVVKKRPIVPTKGIAQWLGIALEEEEEDEYIVSGAVLADSGITSRLLSDAIRLTDADVPEAIVDAHTLAAEWGAARSSIQSWTDQGLVPMMSRQHANSRARLVFTQSVVDSFRSIMHEQVARAGTRHRIAPDDVEELYARALAARSTCSSADDIWNALSLDEPYSPSAIRNAVIKYAKSIGSAAFHVKEHASESTRARVWRAYNWGAQPRVIADRYKLTSMSVRRIALEEQAKRLRTIARESPLFEGWESIKLDDALSPAQLDQIPTPLEPQQPPVDVRVFVEDARGADWADASDEHLRASAFASELLHSAHHISALEERKPAPDLLDAAETRLRRAERHHRQLLWMLRRTVVETALQALPDSHRADAFILQRVLHVAFEAACNSVLALRSVRSLTEPHARLAGGVSLDVTRAVVRSEQGTQGRQTGGKAAPTHVPLQEWRNGLHVEHTRLCSHPRLPAICQRLDKLDAQLLCARHGISLDESPGSLPPTAHLRTTVAERCSVTTARVLNAERRARALARAELF